MPLHWSIISFFAIFCLFSTVDAGGFFGVFRAKLKCPVVPRFQCPVDNPSRDKLGTVARRVHPSDISIVAAMGDSITAGVLMNNGKLPYYKNLEHRSRSFATGSKLQSLAQIIKKYRKGQGFMGISKKKTAIYTDNSAGSGFNFAVTASVASDLQLQFEKFVKTITEPRRRFFGLWKSRSIAQKYPGWTMITVWIGAVDICRERKVETFGIYMRAALERLRKLKDKVIVHLIQHMDITGVYEITKDSKWCRSFQSYMKMCAPLFNEGALSQASRRNMQKLLPTYNLELVKIGEEYRKKNYPGFMVLTQGGLANLDIRKMNRKDFLSHTDCFHPNGCANEQFSLRLWNSFFTPPEKDYVNAERKEWFCPAKTDYFQ
eukprot:Partr_v1_DN25169_c2_g1_i1_m76808 putative Phospholipase B1